jgi:hypothetical protein
MRESAESEEAAPEAVAPESVVIAEDAEDTWDFVSDEPSEYRGIADQITSVFSRIVERKVSGIGSFEW